MAKKPYLWLVWTRCAPELDAEFNKWYDEIHLPMLNKGGHIKAVTRYKLSPEAPSEQPPYLAVYEFKDAATFKAWLSSEALAEARKEMKGTWGGRDMEIKARAFYEPIGK